MYYIVYRYDPAKTDFDGPAGNGAIITDEFETEAERQEALTDLRADPRIQYAHETGDQSSPSKSCGQ